MGWWRYLIQKAISAGKVLLPAAWSYDNRIGTIWVLEVGTYDSSPIGDKIGIAEPVYDQGGYYDNRE